MNSKKTAGRRPPFTPGDIVVSKCYGDEGHIVRRITSCVKCADCGSGWRASADGGEECPTCHRTFGSPIPAVDSDWFTTAPGST